MENKKIQIGKKFMDLPLIQGGMGVGVSLGNLAGHVARTGAMGIISCVDIGYRKANYYKESLKANLEALREEIEKAKTISEGKGLVGINMMVAANQYKETIECAVKAGIDTVISGAGLPLALPEYVKGSDVAIAPIVSSGKACRVICKSWDKHYQVSPDFVVLEGPKAGGHLGFKREELEEGKMPKLSDLLQDVKKVLASVEEKYQKHIPVFVAGGIFSGQDVADAIRDGADGVQVGTRFIATYECDAPQEFKDLLLAAGKDDIGIVQSPVGMPGRAIHSALLERMKTVERIPPTFCTDCLAPCNPKTTKYCISKALISAAQGNVEEGLFFAGTEGYRITKLQHVDELVDELLSVWRKNA